MAFQHNLKKGIDLPIWQWLRFLPASASAGACACNDERGTDRFIYFLFSGPAFWRYDTWTDSWQQLAAPSGTFAAGAALCFDPSRNYIWCFLPSSSSPYCTFSYYNIATNTWTSRAVPSGLSAQWGTDACLIHTCTSYNSNGNDDYLYLIGNNSTTWYRYSISGNSWTTMTTALPAAAGAGCWLHWVFGFDADRIYYGQGGGSAVIRYYSISGGTFTTVSYQPATETFTTGTSTCYNGTNRIYLQKDATHRLYYLQLDENKMYPSGIIPYSSGTAHVGDGLIYVKTEDGAEYLYYRRQTGTEFWRTLIFW